MKCDEVQQLHGLCLDSELDARTTLEIHLHVAACPDCARIFAESERLDALVTSRLSQGQRTSALWEQIERSVFAAAPSASLPKISAGQSVPPGWLGVFSNLGDQLRSGLRRSARAWAGLAAVWALILILNFGARETEAPLLAGANQPSASEMRFALGQKRLLLAELSATPEPDVADKPKATPPDGAATDGTNS